VVEEGDEALGEEPGEERREVVGLAMTTRSDGGDDNSASEVGALGGGIESVEGGGRLAGEGKVLSVVEPVGDGDLRRKRGSA